MKKTVFLFLALLLLFSCKKKNPTVFDNYLADGPVPPHSGLSKIEESPDKSTVFVFTDYELTKLIFLSKDKVTSYATYNFSTDKQQLTVVQFDSNDVEIKEKRATYYYKNTHLISQGQSTDSVYSLFESNENGLVSKRYDFKKGKKEKVITYEYLNGPNLSLETHYVFANGDSTKSYEVAYEYDTRFNPIKYISPQPFPTEIQLYSEKNITKKTVTYQGSNTKEVTNTSYTYDSDIYPAVSTVTQAGSKTKTFKFVY